MPKTLHAVEATPTSGPVYVSLDDAGVRLSVHSRTLRRAIARGEIPAYKFGTALRVKIADIDAWAASNAVPAAQFRA